ALHHPLLFLVLLAAFIVLMIWLLPKIWRGIKALVARIRALFTGRNPGPKGHPQDPA
ncbi:DUF4126 domain-containing protein, partial [Candidatus Parcubacteria bacterium]